jgi:hypothetical protein
MTSVQITPIAPTHQRTTNRDPKLCPTDAEAIVPKREGQKKQLDKQSWEYVAKSGIAGGAAGCAVSKLFQLI